MKQSHVTSNPTEPLPQCFVSRLEVFADLFTRPTWSNVLVLLAGAILAPGRRTVTATLRILGLDGDPHFCTFHRILNRARWSSREVAGRLFLLVSIPRQSRGLYVVSRSKRLSGALTRPRLI